MWFTDTSSLNSIEAIMKKLPYGSRKGGGRFRSPYKKDNDPIFIKRREGSRASDDRKIF